MVERPDMERVRGRVEELDSLRSPGADYGLQNDFDPSKYDFYNPVPHNPRKILAKHLEDERSATNYDQEEDGAQSIDPHDPGTPEPLSPIEELDDEVHPTRPPPRSADSLLSTSFKDEPARPTRTVDSGHASLNEGTLGSLSLEQRADLLFSRQHLEAIFADQQLALKFTTFLRAHRPNSLPILAYYLQAVKALKTIRYAESIVRALEPIPGHPFTTEANSATMAWVMEDKVDRALDVLVKDDMPAFIAFIYVKTVDLALVDRVTGKQDPSSRAIADGLAEVFVLSDPARPDNPIVFSSEEFHRMTGYSRKEFLGRNCRLLSGRKTSPSGINRFRASLDAEREHCEVLVNYHRDGSPFINLVMCVPLRDQSNRVRYYLGAQLDITELVNTCTEFASLRKVIQQEEKRLEKTSNSDVASELSVVDGFRLLGEALNPHEIEMLVMLSRRQQADFGDPPPKEEVILETPSSELKDLQLGGIAPALGYYQNYLLVRPPPSLRILFASPELRIPGILQQSLMKSIGGSSRVRRDLAHALEVGRKVTAKVQWLSTSVTKSNTSWIHCTPLLGADDTVGVWMVILVDADAEEDTRNDREVAKTKDRTEHTRAGNYKADAVPWDATPEGNTVTGVSTTIWSESDSNLQEEDEFIQTKPRRATRRMAPESILPSPPSKTRASPILRVGGKAHPYNSADDKIAALDDPHSIEGNNGRQPGIKDNGPESVRNVDKRPLSRDDRPSNQGSSRVPMQAQMRPTVKIAGRSSFEEGNPKPPPINMPGPARPNADDDPDGLRPVRKRTYKSLSPYGIIFDD